MLGVIGIVVTVFLGLSFLGIVGAAVTVMVVRMLPGKPTPEEIVRERYARGEIDAHQFEETLARLSTRGAPGSVDD